MEQWPGVAEQSGLLAEDRTTRPDLGKLSDLSASTGEKHGRGTPGQQGAVRTSCNPMFRESVANGRELSRNLSSCNYSFYTRTVHKKPRFAKIAVRNGKCKVGIPWLNQWFSTPAQSYTDCFKKHERFRKASACLREQKGGRC